MKFSYTTVERMVLSGPDRGTKKTYAVLSELPKRSLVELAERVSLKTRIHPLDVERMLRELTHVIRGELESGAIVELEGLGSFRPVIHCRPADSPEAFTKRNIEKVSVCFRPGKGLQLDRDRLVSRLHRKFRYPSHWHKVLKLAP